MEKINGGLSNDVFKYKNIIIKFYNYSELELNYAWEEWIQNYLNHNQILLTPKIHQSIIADNKLMGRIEEFVESKPLEKTEFLSQTKKCAQILKKIHKLETKVLNFNLPIPDFFDYINQWEQIALALPPNELSHNIGQLYESVTKLKTTIEETCEKYKIAKCVSHNDFQQLNLLVGSNSNWYLIDWEYSALNYPFYDIANYFAECAMNNNDLIWEDNLYPSIESRYNFYREYFDEINDFEHIEQIIQLFALLVEYVWFIWSVIKYNQTKSPDYLTYGLIRKNNFIKLSNK